MPDYEAVGRLLSQPPELGLTLAVVAVHGGEVVAEAYGPETDADTTLISWSTAKSVTQALVGIAVRDGLLDLDEPAPVAEWRGDERSAITIRQLLTMTPGLRFVEDYVDAGISDCLEMLFGGGQHDVAAYAAALPLEHAPGTVWNYSSGTTNIVTRILGERVGGGRDGMQAWMTEQLFGPLGMTSADPRFDDAGTFVGSSYLYATARDFARFGSLYLDGGRDILPGWVDLARTPVPLVRRRSRSGTAPTGGCGRIGPGPLPPTATRASTSSSSPIATWCWCGSARRPPTCVPTSSACSATSSRRSPWPDHPADLG